MEINRILGMNWHLLFEQVDSQQENEKYEYEKNGDDYGAKAILQLPGLVAWPERIWKVRKIRNKLVGIR